MAKKKMTAAQAAAVRRPDDWEPPKASTKKRKKGAEPAGSARDAVNASINDKEGRGVMIGFGVLFVVAAIAAPFIVIYVSSFLGI